MGLFGRKKQESEVCAICGKSGNLKNLLISANSKNYHKKCFNERPENDIFNYENEGFSKIRFEYESELAAMVEFDYLNPTTCVDRMFFGKEKNDKIYSKDFLTTSKNNFAYIRIIPSPKRNVASFEYGGNKSIGDNFEAGYTVLITLRDAEPKLRKYLISVMNKNNFGCLPASKTIHCHLNSPNPTEFHARKILDDVVTEISEIKKIVES